MGFEPMVNINLRWFSKPMPSASQPPAHKDFLITGMIGIEPISLVLETNILPLNYTPLSAHWDNLDYPLGAAPVAATP